MRHQPLNLSHDLILRTNELYHDLEQAEYRDRHPEIFCDEVARWKLLGRRLLAERAGPQRILDLGCGTGFVGLQLASWLTGEDVLVCADLSASMLAACRRNLEVAGLACRREFLKLDGRGIRLESASCDAVTMNAVLHHVPDMHGLFVEVDRVLRAGGWLTIAHEPNCRFYRHWLLRANFRIAGLLFCPRPTIGAVLRKLGLIEPVRRLLGRFCADLATDRRILEQVNRQLLNERWIPRPLTQDELIGIVDIHSPTAGGGRWSSGICPGQIQAEYLPTYQTEWVETYNHLGDLASTANRVARRYDALLRRWFPEAGATFTMVMRKPAR